MPRTNSFIFLAFFLAFSGSIFAQNLDEQRKKIATSVDQKNYDEAISSLKAVRKSDSKIFIANNYDYLLARLSEKQSDFATAISNYQAVVDRDSILNEYALWHLSQIMRSTGNLMMERVYLLELATISASGSLLAGTTEKRFARSHLESRNYPEAIGTLSGNDSIATPKTSTKNLIETVKENLPSFGKNFAREDLVLLAEAYLLNQEPEKAKEIYTELANNPPNKDQPDDFALAGVKGLDRLEVGDDNFGKNAPKLYPEKHFNRATIYQFNRNFPSARIHYEAIVKNHPTSEKTPAAIYQIARGYGQERNYEKVVEWSEKLQRDFPSNKLAAAALYQTAGGYASLNKTNEAVKRYVKYIDENPKARNIERAFLNIIDAYRDEGNHKTAIEWAKNAQERFKGEMGEAVALFSQIRIHISQENWQNALNDLNRLKEMKNLGGIRIAGGTNKDEVSFLRGYSLEKLERFDEAVSIYLSLHNDWKKYYGSRANERMLAISSKSNKPLILKPPPVSERQQFTTPKSEFKKLTRENVLQTPNKKRSHKSVADDLLFLGLYDEGTPEIETALRENLANNTGSLSDFPTDIAFTLAVFYKRGDMANRAISYIEPIWKKAPKTYSVRNVPREHLEMLYPKPYEESLIKYGRKNNVDPRFLLSIMRQESRFQANVKSVAAARGLMQFISTTADQMADEMKLKNFRQDDLYNPPTAVRFGSHYVSKIFKDFPNQPPAVAASYNGGEDRMMRWFKRSNTDDPDRYDPDRYVPEVIFSQTKDYVYKVMTNYRIYKMLYDENLRPNVSASR